MHKFQAEFFSLLSIGSGFFSAFTLDNVSKVIGIFFALVLGTLGAVNYILQIILNRKKIRDGEAKT